MKECLDEGRLQGFFDGELPPALMEQAARHIASCAMCARAAREVESENAVFLEALKPEMSMSVPTESLRTRITGAIAGTDLPASFTFREPIVGQRPWLSGLTGAFRFTPQRAVAFASVLAIILIGLIFAAVKLKHNDVVNLTPQTGPQIVKVIPRPFTPSSTPPQEIKDSRPTQALRHEVAPRTQRATVKLIPGEESYLRTIATLDVDLKQSGEQTMTPTARAEYERNLKLVDYAIAATRSKAKRTPNDPDAAGFMFAAYQSKIDMLNSFSEQARLTQH